MTTRGNWDELIAGGRSEIARGAGHGDPDRRTPAGCHHRDGCRVLQPPDGRRRGRHPQHAEGASRRADRSGGRGASRPAGEDDRRRVAARIRERGRCDRMRGRGPARHAVAQRRRAGEQAGRVPDRRQYRRHHYRRQRHLRRWRERRRASRGAVRARRHLHLARGERADQGQIVALLRRSRRAHGQEHRSRGRCLRSFGEGHRHAAGDTGGAAGAGRRAARAAPARPNRHRGRDRRDHPRRCRDLVVAAPGQSDRRAAEPRAAGRGDARPEPADGDGQVPRGLCQWVHEIGTAPCDRGGAPGRWNLADGCVAEPRAGRGESAGEMPAVPRRTMRDDRHQRRRPARRRGRHRARARCAARALCRLVQPGADSSHAPEGSGARGYRDLRDVAQPQGDRVSRCRDPQRGHRRSDPARRGGTGAARMQRRSAAPGIRRPLPSLRGREPGRAALAIDDADRRGARADRRAGGRGSDPYRLARCPCEDLAVVSGGGAREPGHGLSRFQHPEGARRRAAIRQLADLGLDKRRACGGTRPRGLPSAQRSALHPGCGERRVAAATRRWPMAAAVDGARHL